MESGSCWGSCLRNIPAPLRTWIFSELYQTQGHQHPFSKQYLLAAASCNLVVSKSPLGIYVIILNPSQCLLNKHTHFLPAAILILDNLCNLVVFFCLYKIPPFCSPAEHNSSASWVCVSWTSPNKPQINASLFQPRLRSWNSWLTQHESSHRQ